MDLSKFTLEDLFFTAIKAEIDSREAYSIMAGITHNAFLKDRFRFLAEEEKKHRALLESEFHKQLPANKLILPKISPVPLPEIILDGDRMPMSKLIQQAMDAEMAAYDFYTEFALYVSASKEFSVVLGYFARMEQSHYQILKQELVAAEEFEAFDDFNPGMHLGP
ncbi:MAG: ferritin family protein [Thermoplasmata archaeon]